MANHTIVSSDSHIIEPPDLWTSRMGPKFRDRAPLINRVDGVDWWYCDDLLICSVHQGSQSGVRFEEPEKLTFKDIMENVRPGGYIPEEHVKDMDADGMDVNLLYPSAGLALYIIVPDGELLTAVFSIYNNWLAEFCSPFPNRLKGIAMLNTDDVPSCVTELERCANMGFAGAMIPVFPPEHRRYDSPEYEPLWAAAQDLEMPLSLHITTGRADGRIWSTTVEPHVFTNFLITNSDFWVRVSLTDMIMTGVFERYPKLMVGSVEHELNWIPYYLERLDYDYNQRARVGYRMKDDLLPSDIFRRNVFHSFQGDVQGIKNRDVIGVDGLLWGSDYPHQESTFPRSLEILDQILSECSEEERAKISGGNAARVYQLN